MRSLQQAKLIAIPLAFAAIAAGIFLLAEDFLAFSEGRQSVIGLLIEGIKKLSPALGGFFEFLAFLVGFTVGKIVEGFKNLFDWITFIASSIGGFISGIGAKVKDFLGPLFNAANATAGGFLPAPASGGAAAAVGGPVSSSVANNSESI